MKDVFVLCMMLSGFVIMGMILTEWTGDNTYVVILSAVAIFISALVLVRGGTNSSNKKNQDEKDDTNDN